MNNHQLDEQFFQEKMKFQLEELQDKEQEEFCLLNLHNMKFHDSLSCFGDKETRLEKAKEKLAEMLNKVKVIQRNRDRIIKDIREGDKLLIDGEPHVVTVEYDNKFQAHKAKESHSYISQSGACSYSGACGMNMYEKSDFTRIGKKKAILWSFLDGVGDEKGFSFYIYVNYWEKKWQ